MVCLVQSYLHDSLHCRIRDADFGGREVDKEVSNSVKLHEIGEGFRGLLVHEGA